MNAMDDEPIPFPAGTGLNPAPDLRTKDGGRILIGGAPFTIMRLSRTGAETCRNWFRGGEIGPGRAEQALARRLLDRGLAGPRAPQDRSDEQPSIGANDRAAPAATEVLTVVIPVRDDHDGLQVTLAGLTAGPDTDGRPMTRVVVVDDGSAVPVTAPPDRPAVTVVRNERPTGPGQARQRGLAHVTTPLVAFVDAAVTVDHQNLIELAERFNDKAVVAAAPRVLSEPAPHAVGRYDLRRSPLDLGPGPSLVGPGRMVPYVPTACLVARRDAVAQVGGFDPDLRFGEDVDLVWRLARIGDVRYCPSVTVSHPPRDGVVEMARQRRSYGSAAAPLASRHGNAVAPTRLSGWSVLVSALAAAGQPTAALGLAGWTAMALRPKIEPMPDVTVEAALLTGRGHWYGGLSLLTALARTWAPLALAGAVVLPSGRRRILGLLGLAFARRLLDGPRDVRSAAADLALGVVDDLSYCAGVWQGTIAERSIAALQPALNDWPGPADNQ